MINRYKTMNNFLYTFISIEWVIFLIIIVVRLKKKNKSPQANFQTEIIDNREQEIRTGEEINTDELLKRVNSAIYQPNKPTFTDYKNCYQNKSLFTQNEYRHFLKLVSYAKENDMHVFAKVRLLDLIEPRDNLKNNKELLYKVQSKHVDFVVTDNKYNVIAIIELDDNSHLRPDRIRRDNFVNEILTNVGYRIIRTRAITNDILNSLRATTPNPS